MLTSSSFHFVCKRCKAYCCKLILPPITGMERQKILQAGFPDHFKKIQDDLYIIKPDKSSKCPYLTENYSCSIHTVKPQLCLLWPIIPSFKNKKKGSIVVQCPLYPYLSKNAVNKAISEADHIPSYIIEYLWNISSEEKQKYKRFHYQRN